MPALSPILSTGQVLSLEADIMGGDPEREWPVIQEAGAAIGQGMLNDYNELRPLPRDPVALILLGKGHNAADALVAAREILLARPRGKILLLPLHGREHFRPLTEKAAALLDNLKAGTVEWLDPAPFWDNPEGALASVGSVDFLDDGILGLGARLPLDKTLCDLIRVLNLWENAAVRVAVDLPTGLGSGEGITEILRADWTYAAGSVKSCLVSPEHQGLMCPEKTGQEILFKGESYYEKTTLHCRVQTGGSQTNLNRRDFGEGCFEAAGGARGRSIWLEA
jgi:NAD(P)H-hydrate repair Nnr-like enzyme with NAD(P)H-hydrate epimerase domain